MSRRSLSLGFVDRVTQSVSGGEEQNTEQLVAKVNESVDRNPSLEHFFKGKPDYIREIAKKANELVNDPSTPLGDSDLLPKTIKVTLHQQVIYCGMFFNPSLV